MLDSKQEPNALKETQRYCDQQSTQGRQERSTCLASGLDFFTPGARMHPRTRGC